MTQELQEKFHQEFMNVMLLYNEKILRQIKGSFKDTFSPAQFFTLSAIVSNNGLSMSQLAQMSSMQKQQVTKLVGFLADARLYLPDSKPKGPADHYGKGHRKRNGFYGRVLPKKFSGNQPFVFYPYRE